ncbi:MAG: ATP-dependent DNA helicase RecG [Candidatus Aureabacteria bacterium]|nr:ATP-dependent DNA helicase RecG [Candidatus Auribacterota bacterium]
MFNSVRYLKGVGPAKYSLMVKMGIHTIYDLLNYLPRKYEDRSNFVKVRQIREAEKATFIAQVEMVGCRRTRDRKEIISVAFSDETGVIYGVWFNQPYMKTVFEKGQRVIITGKASKYARLQLVNPEYEILDSDDYELINTGRIVPFYSVTEGLSQKVLRRVIKNLLDTSLGRIEEYLPRSVMEKRGLAGIRESYLNAHFPETARKALMSRKSLAFREFFLFHANILNNRDKAKRRCRAVAHTVDGKLFSDFISALPFKLTGAQIKALLSIKRDMEQNTRMNRLLQGDVGSGKTVVAVCAAYIAVMNGRQAVFMAPTEILAEQHMKTICSLVSPRNIKTAFIRGNMKKKERDDALKKIENGEYNIIVGTHALLGEDIRFASLSLVVIDEQHKFGVIQREKLVNKGLYPDTLVMTATPIPRTLAVTVYGDMDVSVINSLPQGRIPVKTFHITGRKLDDAYNFIKKKVLAEGDQAYIVYPAVEDSGRSELKSVTDMYRKLSGSVFSGISTELVHGKLKTETKDSIMKLFMDNEIKILFATSIIEVGMDNPMATVMLVENAERYGLSQLHQLRGRVGRGKKQSYCILLSDGKNEQAEKRIDALVKINDGFKIAEIDLALRGPGQFHGTKQHGISDFRVADVIEDREMLFQARHDAKRILMEDPRIMRGSFSFAALLYGKKERSCQ